MFETTAFLSFKLFLGNLPRWYHGDVPHIHLRAKGTILRLSGPSVRPPAKLLGQIERRGYINIVCILGSPETWKTLWTALGKVQSKLIWSQERIVSRSAHASFSCEIFPHVPWRSLDLKKWRERSGRHVFRTERLFPHLLFVGKEFFQVLQGNKACLRVEDFWCSLSLKPVVPKLALKLRLNPWHKGDEKDLSMSPRSACLAS